MNDYDYDYDYIFPKMFDYDDYIYDYRECCDRLQVISIEYDCNWLQSILFSKMHFTDSSRDNYYETNDWHE